VLNAGCGIPELPTADPSGRISQRCQTMVPVRAALLPAALLLVAACIPIPYKPSATAASDANVAVAPDTVISCGEDGATEALAKRIVDRDSEITVAAHQDIEALAFPDGDSTIGQLTDPERRTRLSRDFGVAYLVLVGDVADQETRSHGGFVPLLGAGTWTNRTDVSACIIDLADGRMLASISAATEARSSGVIYGFYGVFLVPMSESSVYDAISDSLVAAIRAGTPAGPVKIAVAHASGLQASACPDGEACPENVPAAAPPD